MNSDRSHWAMYISRLLMLAGMALVGGSLFALVAAQTLPFWFPIHDPQSFLQDPTAQALYPGATLLVQGAASLGMFLAPSLTYSLILRKGFTGAFQWNKDLSFKALGVVLLLAFFINPVVDLAYQLNQLIQIPESWGPVSEWLQKQNETITANYQAMLGDFSPGRFLLTLFVIAVIPALGEEMFFRGLLQPLMQEWTGRKHLGIWIAAGIFALIHWQFNLLIPRLFLGAFIGYLFWWSGNLWYAISAHFINNLLALVISYFYPEAASGEPLPAGPGPEWIFQIAGLFLFAWLLYLFYKFATNSSEKHGKELG